MLDKPRDRKPLWKKLAVSFLAVLGCTLFFQLDNSAAASWRTYLMAWGGILLVAWAIIIGVHWFMLEEVGDAMPNG